MLQRGDQNRIFAATEMNAHSSRSHAIVIVTVFKQRKRAVKRVENGVEVQGQCAPPMSLRSKCSVLISCRCACCDAVAGHAAAAVHMVILAPCHVELAVVRLLRLRNAGSFRSHAQHSCAQGDNDGPHVHSRSRRLRAPQEEQVRRPARARGKAINLSLHTLGMCVNARSDPNSQHVPFRDSKLTRLLQESLGGNAKTSMLIAVSDVREHADETFQSCVFGSRAILVRTAPVITSTSTSAPSTTRSPRSCRCARSPISAR